MVDNTTKSKDKQQKLKELQSKKAKLAIQKIEKQVAALKIKELREGLNNDLLQNDDLVAAQGKGTMLADNDPYQEDPSLVLTPEQLASGISDDAPVGGAGAGGGIQALAGAGIALAAAGVGGGGHTGGGVDHTIIDPRPGFITPPDIITPDIIPPDQPPQPPGPQPQPQPDQPPQPPHIDPVNDAAVITTAPVSVTEDTTTSATVQLTVTDTDKGEDHFIAGTLTGAHGTATITEDGTLVYTLDNAAAQHLNVGEAITDTITVTSFDGTSKDVTVSIHGTNDNPVINAITAQSVDEDGATVTGQITSTDVDDGDSATYSTTATHAGFTFNADGSYTLDPTDQSFQHLAVGESEVITIPVTATDKHGGTDVQDLVITVNGTNDLPVIDAITAQSVDEDGTKVTGQITSTDVDTNDSATYSTTVTHAGFTLNGDGSYTLDPTDQSFQHLAVGESEVITIPVTATDKHGGTDVQDLVITVHGTNDTPVVSGAVILPPGTEDKTQTFTTHQLIANTTDVDTTDVLTIKNVNVDHGKVSVDSSGTVHFTPEANYNGKVTFNYNVTDSHGGTVATSATTNLAAVQDAAVITAPAVDVTEDTTPSITVKLGIADPDAGEDHFQAGTLTGAHGSAILTADGTFTYNLDNNAAQHLNVGQAITDTITVTSFDGTSKDVTVTIHGTNDNPVLDAITAQSVHEDGTKVTGQITSTDVDTADSATYSTTVTHAGFTLNADGSYTLDPTDQSFQHLAVGESEVITIPVTATDTHGGTDVQDLVITVHGTNDTPVVSGAVILPLGTEDKTQTFTTHQLIANTTDVDTTDVLTIKNVKVDHGAVSVDSSGTVHFTPELNYNGKVTFNYNVTDSNGGTVATSATTDLAAVNDAAVIVAPFIDVTEDTTPSITVKLGIADPDAGEDHFQAGTLTGAHGSAILTADGTFTYNLDNNAAQHLNVGQAITDTITVTSFDGTSKDVTVTIHGTNDKPVLGAITAQSVDEDGATVTGQITSTDVDTNDSATYSTTVTHAGFTLNADGSYTLDPTDQSFQHLAVGESEVITIPVTATDTHGGTDVQDLVITVKGTNDNPVISVNQTTNTTGSLTETDVDTSDTHTFDTPNGAGLYGTLSVDSATGDYHYDQTASVANMNYDPQTGEYSGQEIFAVEVKDNHGGIDTKYIEMRVSATVTAGQPPVITTHVTKPPTVTDLQPAIIPPHPPLNAVTIDLAASSDSGVSNFDDLTNDPTPTMIGHTDIPFSQVEIMDNGHVIATVTSDKYGEYSVDTLSLPDATHSLTAQATAPSASTHQTSANLDVTIDTQVAIAITDIDSGSATGGHPVHGANHPGQGANHPHFGSSTSPNIVVSGTTTAEDGQHVSITFDGTNVGNAIVHGGKWTVDIPKSAIGSDGNHDIQASVGDKAGNNAHVTTDIDIDTTPPTVSIDAISTDNVINAQEHGQPLVITGTTDAENGQTVHVDVNGKDHTALATNGHFTTTVPATEVGAFTDGQPLKVTATVTDIAGNNAQPAIAHLTVDTSATVSIDAISTDNVINATEHNSPLPISGTVAGVESGQIVTVTLNNHNYSATVDANGAWTTTVAQTDVSSLATGLTAVNATVTDQAGNVANATHPLMVTDAFAGTASTVDITDGGNNDGFINATEQTQAEISGTIDPGATLSTLTITDTDGKTQDIDLHPSQVSVDANGHYIVHNVDVSSLTDGTLTANATATDHVGNVSSATDNIGLDTAIPQVSATLIPVINSTTPNPHAVVTVTGPVPAGTIITTTIPDPQTPGGTPTVVTTPVPITGGPVDVPIPVANQGNITPSFVVTTPHGNTAPAVTATALIDTIAPTVSIDAISTDNVINAQEHGQPLVITGKTDAENGQTVHVEVNGKDHTAVATNGHFTTTVPATEVGAFTDGQHFNVTATVTDHAGNTAQPAIELLKVDTSATVSIDAISTDNVINATEHNLPLPISGTVAGVESGQIVTVTLNNHNYSATVDANGAWTTTVAQTDVSSLATGLTAVDARVSDQAGNVAYVTHPVMVTDAFAGTASTVDITDGGNNDGFINATEQTQAEISGTIDPGATLSTLTITDTDGKTQDIDLHPSQVSVDAKGHYTVHNVDVSSLTDGTLTAHATATDHVGNVSSATDNIGLDTAIPQVSATLIPVINATTPNPHAVVTVTGPVPVGTIITTTIPNPQTPGTPTVITTLVPSIGGPVDVPIPVTDQGQITPSFVVTTPHGNTAPAVTATALIDTIAPTVSIDAISTDNVINAQEHGQPLVITGTTDAENGQTVHVDVNGKDHTAVATNGHFTTTVPATEVGAFTDGQHLNVIANVTDHAGNTAQPAIAQLTVDTSATVSIDAISTDNVINATEHNLPLPISGTVAGVESGQIVTVTLNNHNYSATVDANGAWTTTVAQTDVSSLATGLTAVDATVTDQAGNVANATHPLMVTDAFSGTASTVDITDGGNHDGFINATEQTQAEISGTIDPGATLSTLTITDTDGKTQDIDLHPSQVSVDAKGHYTVHNVDVSSLTDGTLTAHATATDHVGNVSSATDNIGLDTAIPQVSATLIPVINSTTPNPHAVVTVTGPVPAGTIITTTIPDPQTPGGTPTVVTTPVPITGGPVDVPIPVANQGNITPSFVVTTPHGNTAPAVTATALIDTIAPTVSIDAISTDNVINAQEHGQPLVITGKTDAENGQTVHVDVNGKDHTAVATNGHFMTTVPATEVGAFTDGQHLNVIANVTDHAGNTAPPATAHLTVDTSAVVSIDAISTDNVINATEHNLPLVISGTVTGVESGQIVNVTINNHIHNTRVDANGTWTTMFSKSEVSSLAIGSTDVNARVSDHAGNHAKTTHPVLVTDAFSGTASTVDITDGGNHDGFINATEQTQAEISGTIDPGATLSTLTITDTDGKTQDIDLHPSQVSVDANGHYIVHNVDVSSLTDGTLTANATATDHVGNVSSATDNIGLDTAIPQVSATLIPVINSTTPNPHAVVTVTGPVPAGTIITTTIPDPQTPGGTPTVVTTPVPITGGPVDVPIPVANQGNITPSFVVTTPHGNTAPAVTATALIDTIAPTVSIDAISTDNVINAQEHGQPLVITGKTDAENGQTVHVDVNGKDHTAVATNGHFMTTVPATEVGAFTDGQHLNVIANVTDHAGNTAPPATAHLTVDTSAVVSIDAISTDNVINATEHNLPLVISGTVTGVESGQIVNVTINNHIHNTRVDANGTWTTMFSKSEVSSLAIGSTDVNARVSDHAGNHAKTTHPVLVTDAFSGTASTVDITDGGNHDGFINATEQTHAEISGTIDPGATLSTLTITDTDGKTQDIDLHPSQVSVDANGHYIVHNVDVSSLTDGTLTAHATATDQVGNVSSATDNIGLDTAIPQVSATLIPVINATTPNPHAVVTVTGPVPVGTIITTTIPNPQTPGGTPTVVTTPVPITGGPVDVPIPVGHQGNITPSFVVTTPHGNTAPAVTATALIDTIAPTISIDPITTDNMINAQEHGQPLVITGTTTAENNQVVTVHINGKDYTGAASHGHFTTTVPAQQVGAFTDGQHLKVTANVTDHAGNHALPAHGAVGVDISINAKDDAATIDEDAQTAITGNVMTNDDHSNGESVAATSALQTAHGVYTLNSDGSYTFTVDNAASQSLAAGQSATDTLTYEITDTAGNTATATLTTTITGTNDAAVITTAPVSVTEDTTTSATAHLTVTDVDAGEDHFTAGTIQGAHGSAVLTADGTFTYNLKNAAAQHLNAGETMTDHLMVTSFDGTSKDVSVTINGTNDKPVLGTITAQSTNEDGTQVSGQITSTDADTHDSATYSTTATHAGFTFNADGSYTLDPTDTSFQHLAVGESEVITIPVTVTDKNGATDSQNLIITVHGTNDIPVVGGSVTLPASVENTAQSFTTAQLLAHTTDVDTSDKHHIIQGISVSHGQVTQPDSNGVIHFTPNPGFHGQAEFHYAVTDGHSNAIQAYATTDVANVQHAAVITTAPISVTEDNTPSARVHLTVSDADAGEDHFIADTLHGAFGSATLAENGTLFYTLDNNAVQHLNVGQAITDHFTVSSADGTTKEVSVTINGTNDVPVIAAITAQSVTEGGAIVTGQIAATDVDTHDTYTFSTTSSQGGFTINPDGSYSLDPTDPSLMSLAQGSSLTLNIPIVATDSHGGNSVAQFLQVTVTGTNNLPVVSGAVTLPQGTEDKTLNFAESELLANTHDPDSGDQLSVAHLQVNHGTFTLTHGQVHFTPEADYNGIVTFNYDVTDQYGATVHTSATTDLSAVADKAVISVLTGPAEVTEDTQQITTIQLGITDPDAGEASFHAQTFATALGDAVLKADGTLTYTLSNGSVQYLGESESTTDTITVTSADGTTQNVIVTINGTNDAPVLAAITTSYSTSEGGQPVTGTIHATDVDHHDTLTYTTSSNQAGFTLSADGSYVLDPQNPIFDHLAAGEVMSLSIPIVATDNHGAQSVAQNLHITITGMNDYPVVSGVATLPAGVTGVTQIITIAQLLANSSDVDSTDALTISNFHADHGTFTTASNGDIHFVPDANYQGKVTFNYDVTDGHSTAVAASATLDLSAGHTTAATVTASANHPAPPVVHDAAQITSDEILVQIDTDLADTNQHITSTLHEINELKASGHDTADAQAKLDGLTEIKTDLLVEKAETQHGHTTANEAEAQPLAAHNTTDQVAEDTSATHQEASPVDHYITMAGLDPSDIAAVDHASVASDNLAPFVAGDFSDGADPLIDDIKVDGFENPLDDAQDKNAQHHDAMAGLEHSDDSTLANDDQSQSDVALQDVHVHTNSNGH